MDEKEHVMEVFFDLNSIKDGDHPSYLQTGMYQVIDTKLWVFGDGQHRLEFKVIKKQ